MADRSATDKVTEVMRIIETLDYPELKRLCDLIGEEYRAKSEAAKARVIAEARERFEELGLSFAEVAEMGQKRKRASRTPSVQKYRSPNGKTWTGRGVAPKWIKEHEANGGNREEFLINEPPAL